MAIYKISSNDFRNTETQLSNLFDGALAPPTNNLIYFPNSNLKNNETQRSNDKIMFISTLHFMFNSFSYILSSVYFIASLLHTVLPFGLDVGLVGASAYFMTKLKKPDAQNVANIFGPLPGSRESEQHPEKVVKCIAHRGAGLDAPENTMEAFKYVSFTGLISFNSYNTASIIKYSKSVSGYC